MIRAEAQREVSNEADGLCQINLDYVYTGDAPADNTVRGGTQQLDRSKFEDLIILCVDKK